MCAQRRIRCIGESVVALTETYPKGVLFVGRTKAGGARLEKRIVGTAFLVTVSEPPFVFLYVVTAAHVVVGSQGCFVRVPMEAGEPRDLDVPEWVTHPTYDVAVAPIALPPGHDMRSTELAQFIDDPQWRVADDWFGVPFDMELGDIVYFIGLLGKIEAMTDRTIPIVRAGVLGRLWQERVPVRRSPVDAVEYLTAHLIDCRSFAGFSGAPCYIQQSTAGTVPLPEGGVGITSKFRTALLGLIGGHFDDWMRTRDRDGYTGGVSDNIEAPVSTGVGYVIPAEFIRETLMLEELSEMRRKAQEELAARPEDAATMDTTGMDSNTEFERFRDLAQKLTQVPKKELDEKRKDES